MKMHCRTCGCHFDDDFEETLKPECGMWRERGFSDDMSEEHKRAIFDAFFSVPVDEIADATGVVTDIQIKAFPGMNYSGNQFEEMVPGYLYMTDRERRDFQKRYFKFYYNENPRDRMLRQLEVMGELKELMQKAYEGANKKSE
jgi:hypothetical protein